MQNLRAASRALAFIYRIMERLVPTAGHECFISFPDVDDNAFAIYAELLLRPEQPDTKLVWLVGDTEAALHRLEVRLRPSYSGRFYLARKNTLRGLWLFLRANRIYFTHGHYHFVRRSSRRNKLVNLWHGMPLKAIGLLDGKPKESIQASDVLIASSEFFRPIMAQAFGLPESNVLVTGLPRCDALATRNAEASGILRSMFPHARKIVVWMPTYRGSSIGDIRHDSVLDYKELADQFQRSLQALSRLAGEASCAVLVKLHPMDILNNEVAPDLPSVAVLRSDAPVFKEIGLYELLASADGLITDVSSVCFDFMATGRAILITRDFVTEYSRNLLFNPEELFAVTWTCENWCGAEGFFRAVSAGTSFDGGYRKFCKFHDGVSSARVLASLLGRHTSR